MESVEEPSGFAALGLDPALVAITTALGYEEPTAIQKGAIPLLVAGRDVLGQAATGTGKTAAFALPMLHRIGRNDGSKRKIRGLVLVPTRELAMQVAEAVHKYGRNLDTAVLPVFGGQSYGQQLRALARGVDVVVATPGRAIDHIDRKTLDLSNVEFLVLDEADEMLDMGFADELDQILAAVPKVRQTALFSATLAPRIKQIAKKHLNNPENVTIANETSQAGDRPKIREVAFVVQRSHKVAALARILDVESPTSAIIFCRTRTEVDELTQTLGSRGYSAEALHGGLSQEQRDRVLRRFREGTSDVLVATDVAARGLDIEHVSHVVNFDVPSSPDAYVHRIGRTGRAGKSGVAITLAEVRENRLLRNIEAHTKRRIPVETVPTVHDLRARRLERTREALETALESKELDKYRSIVESLATDRDIVDVAAAALKLYDDKSGGAEEEREIPTIVLAPPPPMRIFKTREPRERVAPREGTVDMTRIYVGIGRGGKVRPADLVGAIANEARISSRDIGTIDIADAFSLVEVPADDAPRIIAALSNATIRGKKVVVRLDKKKP